MAEPSRRVMGDVVDTTTRRPGDAVRIELTRREALRSFAAAWLSAACPVGTGTRWIGLFPSVHTLAQASMSSTRSTATDDPFRDKNRLPRHIRPSRYDLSFAPDFATDTFEGQASITLTVTRPAREILLNAVDLEISEASLSGADSSPNRLASNRSPTSSDAASYCRTPSNQDRGS